MLPKLHNAKVFSKIDIKEAYWQVKLDEQSSKLMIMITPSGRYRWARLPFELKVSSELFQKRLHHAIADLTGVVCVADDIIIVGCGTTQELADRDHAKNLEILLERCRKCNVRVNEETMALKKTEVEFLGHKITRDGIEASQKKVQAIVQMPAPTDVTGVRRLCGMVQYLARYTPNLADDLEPIHALTRSNTESVWSQVCQDAFSRPKRKLSETPVLAYYNPDETLVLQVDSSRDGLGAALAHNDKPIEHASRNLRSNERSWAQIETETLALVYGLEKFDQFTYGRKVVVHNDHKSLAAILSKPLSHAPRRLQSLMMRLYRYDIEFHYVKGVQLYLADTLSRAYLHTEEKDMHIMMAESVKIPDQRMNEIREATARDHTMLTLTEYIVNGWPDTKQEVPAEIRPYFDVRDTLSQENGVILKGERIVIPSELRTDMKKRLHAAHLGDDSMMRRARETIFWPGMSHDVRQMADNCVSCQELKPASPRETLLQREVGNVPWEKIGCDLFEISGRNYLIVIDYFSNFIEIDLMTTTTSTQVVSSLKKMCARFGTPRQIVSDGGPQFTSREFEVFVKSWGIDHVTSSPNHQQANGKAESAVKLVKAMMEKCVKTGSDQYLALLELRNTPRQDTNASPAQMMFSRKLLSVLPAVSNSSKSCYDPAKRAKRQKSVKKYYDKRAHNLPQLEPNQSVFFRKLENDHWKKGRIVAKHSDRAYIVNGESGCVYRRNRVHIRPTTVTVQDCELVVSVSPVADEELISSPSATGEVHEPPTAIVPGVPVESTLVSARPVRTRQKPTYLKDYV